MRYALNIIHGILLCSASSWPAMRLFGRLLCLEPPQKGTGRANLAKMLPCAYRYAKQMLYREQALHWDTMYALVGLMIMNEFTQHLVLFQRTGLGQSRAVEGMDPVIGSSQEPALLTCAQRQQECYQDDDLQQSWAFHHGREHVLCRESRYLLWCMCSVLLKLLAIATPGCCKRSHVMGGLSMKCDSQ